MQIGNQGEAQYVDISGDRRSWADVVPDQYFGPEHVLGKQVVLQIQKIVTEKFEDSLPRAVLHFSNDPKWLRLGKDNKQVLKELFGDSPAAAVGQWITITAGPNSMKNIGVKILPRMTTPAGPSTSPLNKQTQDELAAANQQLKAQLAALQGQAG